ncbi:AbrB/MazE/SpoVT family DNA-binding domain-containing protein [Salisediminibacterium selenitireducens]|uniref:Transcriptional regulator/antitoxin, MazE n=1 Tax=Bacillus selenitireducens (strain ATCC 700615 / DSM 15326 / MLS10) TaxID=439292 RepID=D6XXU0_BACIE|nr:AbrB/MazE/SpoVT family DNA-binding domain-containing protein [Salisediminibacterium selenitireducens]ADI00133.1 transcriptional regulator/antitoxin, MazE [[Bacillus] selenitireducens MLS10]
MTTKLQKWGNSLGVRIPKSHVQQLNVSDGSEIEITLINNSIVIKPVTKKPTLDELLSQVTEDNKHTEIDCHSTGRELL